MVTEHFCPREEGRTTWVSRRRGTGALSGKIEDVEAKRLGGGGGKWGFGAGVPLSFVLKILTDPSSQEVIKEFIKKKKNPKEKQKTSTSPTDVQSNVCQMKG